MNTAGGIVINRNNEILLIYKKGKWDLPKGKQEPKEDLNKTALREVEEETGIDANFLRITSFLMVTPYVKSVKGKKKKRFANWFVMSYTKKCTKTYPQKKESIKKAVWVLQKDLHKYQFKGKKTLNTVLENYYQLKLSA